MKLSPVTLMQTKNHLQNPKEITVCLGTVINYESTKSAGWCREIILDNESGPAAQASEVQTKRGLRVIERKVRLLCTCGRAGPILHASQKTSGRR